MNPIFLALFIGLFIGILLSFKFFSRPLERRRIMSYEFPQGWWQNLYQKFPLSAEFEGKTRQDFSKEIQWALADKEFFALGQKELKGVECVLACAPFILFELHSQGRPLKELKRFLITDETLSKKPHLKTDPHDFILNFSRRTAQVSTASDNELKTSSKKILTQIFGEKFSVGLTQSSIFQSYVLQFKSPRLLNAPDALSSVLKNEFYLPAETDEEELIWKLHDILCYSPHELKKALPKTYQALMQYYELEG